MLLGVSEQARKALNTDGSPASARRLVPGGMSWGRRKPRAAGEALRARVSRCKCKPKVVPQRDQPDVESGVVRASRLHYPSKKQLVERTGRTPEKRSSEQARASGPNKAPSSRMEPTFEVQSPTEPTPRIVLRGVLLRPEAGRRALYVSLQRGWVLRWCWSGVRSAARLRAIVLPRRKKRTAYRRDHAPGHGYASCSSGCVGNPGARASGAMPTRYLYRLIMSLRSSFRR